MFGSSRPVPTMPAVAVSGFLRPVADRSATGLPAHAALPPAAIRPAVWSLCRRAWLGPLALSAVALSAAAAPHRQTTHPAAHPTHTSTAVHASASRTASSASAAPRRGSSQSGHRTAAATARAEAADRQHGRYATANRTTAPTHGRRGATTAEAEGPLSRRERQVGEKAGRTESFAALWDRAGRSGGTGGAAGTPPGESAAARDTARLDPTHDLLSGRSAARHPAPQETAEADVDAAADARTESRVHAWYRAQHPASDVHRDTISNGSSAGAVVDRKLQAAATRPDLAPAARKATSADFAHAAAMQRDTIAAARDQQAHQTTADDDNADAESRIPGTAPTEREPLPFVHGSFGEGVAADAPVNLRGRNTPPVSQQQPAPIEREPATSASAVGIHLAPPEHLDMKHRGDGLTTAIAAEKAGSVPGNLADENRPMPPSTQHGSAVSQGSRNIPVAVAADSSPRAVRDLAQQVAGSPTPVLKLPAPPSGALHKELPAVAAVESGVRHRELDPTVTSGMAEETFEEGGSPATARTAVALAAPAAVAGLVPVRTHVAPASDPDANLPPAAVIPVNLFDHEGKLILVPPMRGSHEILVHQNQMAVSDGLDRIQDDGDLLELRQRKLLVALPDEDSTYPDDRLPANRRYARPWTVRFLRDLARAHYARFGTPLIVTSAARTVAFQRRLVRVNGNAAPPTGDIASPHLYGQAIDIGKGRMSLTELTWMRAYLTPVESDGKIDVEEEFQQSCFHISVYRRYLGLPTPQRRETPAAATLLEAKQAPVPEAAKPTEKKRRRISTALLATGIR